MTQNVNGLWNIIIGGFTVFANLDFEEALSGLLFIGQITNGICKVNGEEICSFVDNHNLPQIINLKDLVQYG